MRSDVELLNASRSAWSGEYARRVALYPAVVAALTIILSSAVVYALAYGERKALFPIFGSSGFVADSADSFCDPIAYFAVDGAREGETADPDEVGPRVQKALDYLADSVENAANVLQLELWGLDNESLAAKRLFLLTNAEIAQLSYDLEAARELAAGRWGYLAADACLRRFDKRMRSELTDDRYFAIEEAEPFAAALAAATSQGTFETSAQIGSPVTLGVAERVKGSAQTRYFLAEDRLSGVAAAKTLDRRAAPELTLRLLAEARERFPELTIELDDQNAARFAERRVLLEAALRALPWLGAALILGGWLTFGGLRRALAAALTSIASGIVGAVPAWLFCADGPELFGALFTIGGYSVFCGSSYLLKYASTRSAGRPTGDSLAITSAALTRRSLLGALTFTFAGIVCFLTPDVGARQYALSVAAGVPIAAIAVLGIAPAFVKLAEGTETFKGRGNSLALGLTRRVGTNWRKRVVTLALALTALFAFGASRVSWNEKTRPFLPERCANALRGGRVAEIASRGSLYAVVFPESAERAAILKSRLDEERSWRVDDLESNLPPAPIERVRSIETVADMLNGIPLELGEAPIPAQASVVDALLRATEAAKNAACSCVDEQKRERLLNALRIAEKNVESFAPSEYRAKIDAFQTLTTVNYVKRLYALRAIANFERPNVGELSEALRSKYLANKSADDGQAGPADGSEQSAIFVYSTSDLRDINALQAFASNVRAIAPEAHGAALTAYDDYNRSRRGAIVGLLIALAAALFLTALRRRSAIEALSAGTPGAFCALAVVGLAGLTKTALDAAAALLPACCFLLAFTARETLDDDHDSHARVNDATLLWTIATLAFACGLARSGNETEELAKICAFSGCALFACSYASALARNADGADQLED